MKKKKKEAKEKFIHDSSAFLQILVICILQKNNVIDINCNDKIKICEILQFFFSQILYITFFPLMET